MQTRRIIHMLKQTTNSVRHSALNQAFTPTRSFVSLSRPSLPHSQTSLFLKKVDQIKNKPLRRFVTNKARKNKTFVMEIKIDVNKITRYMNGLLLFGAILLLIKIIYDTKQKENKSFKDLQLVDVIRFAHMHHYDSALIGLLSFFVLIAFRKNIVSIVLVLALLPEKEITSLNKRINNFRHQYALYLSQPVNALKETAFNQSEIIKLINQNYPDVDFNMGGVCEGIKKVWYIYQCLGKDLLLELKEIHQKMDSQTLTEDQINLLKFIQSLQENQANNHFYAEFLGKQFRPIQLSVDEHSIKSSADLDKVLFPIMKGAVEKALTTGHLISITPRRFRFGAHTVGLIARKKEGEILISYFDANYREVTFDNVEHAAKSLTHLMVYNYKAYFALDFRDSVMKRLPSFAPNNLYIQEHSVKCNLRFFNISWGKNDLRLSDDAPAFKKKLPFQREEERDDMRLFI